MESAVNETYDAVADVASPAVHRKIGRSEAKAKAYALKGQVNSSAMVTVGGVDSGIVKKIEGRKIIYNVDLSIVVPEVDESIKATRRI